MQWTHGGSQPVQQLVLVGPHDSLTLLLAERLAASAAAGACRVVHGPGGAYEEALAGSDGVVYRPPLAKAGRPDLADAEALFGACRRAVEASGRPSRLILLSSAAVHDPSHHNPGYLPEGQRPRGTNPIARAWRDLEDLVASCPVAERIVLRPAPVLTRDGRDYFSRLLRGKAAFVPAGYDPALQLLSPEDLAEAVCCAVERGEGKPGVYHVAPAGAVPVRGALRLAGVRRLAVEAGLQRPVRAVASRLGWADPGDQLDYLRHSWTVSGRKIERELGFSPRRTSAEAVLEAFGGGAPDGVPGFDDYGLDEGYIAAYGRTLFRFLHDVYWRIEHQGIENVPRQGRVVLTGVHRGFMPWDGVMALHLLRREIGRTPRFLIHPCLIKFPFLANYMTKLGGILACQENADWILGRDEILGMFPEGIGGAFTPYRDAYKLGKFGRDEYVKMALRSRAPIVPFVTVGSAEIYPILARIDSKFVRRVAEWPYLPITPTFPLPGLPLPSKWHTRFLEPLPVHERYPPEAAEDPEVVHEISREVRARMAAAIQEMLGRRRSIFFGSVFGKEEGKSDEGMAKDAA
ncbi:MAG TPA: 1-acyl-sn-glycerol-3-phosphate acyltransferase [Thermoanaerobaculia bacterium]